MTEKDYYKTLGLEKNASTDDIKKAYRNLAMQYHPDRNHGKEEWANDKFKDINEAFSVLGDPKKKQRYDYYGAIGNIGDIFTSHATRTTFEDLLNDFGEADLGFDFLNDIFDYNLKGRGYTFRRFRGGFSGARGLRFKAHVGVDFEDLFEQTINPKVSSVNYEIVLSQEQALKGIEKELVRNEKRFRIKIPAGVKTGSRIRLKNALIRTDKEPGDIIIKVKII